MAGKAAALVEPGDVAGLAAQMARVASNPALRASMRESGLAHAQQFQWRKTAEATLRVYAKALKIDLTDSPATVLKQPHESVSAGAGAHLVRAD
jgi:hypothetical protein